MVRPTAAGRAQCRHAPLRGRSGRQQVEAAFSNDIVAQYKLTDSGAVFASERLICETGRVGFLPDEAAELVLTMARRSAEAAGRLWRTGESSPEPRSRQVLGETPDKS